MNGILVINKPPGMTSHDVVQALRKILGQKKIGHTGTLDPEATGVLILCLGEATKISQFLQGLPKEYLAQMTLGITTDTEDSQGKILRKIDCRVSKEEFAKVLEDFRGTIEQIPPMVSAVKLGGMPLYKLARRGEVIARKPRKVKIYQLELLKFEPGPNPKASLRVACSKGTYIRTLCADIGKKLGCGAHLSQLVRTRVGDFTLDEAHTLSEIERLNKENKLGEIIIPPNQALQSK